MTRALFASIPKRLLLFLILAAGCAWAKLPGANLSSADKVRFHRLCRKLIAPCCWSLNVDDHMSPAAEQARAEVASMITAGRSDRQILDSFIQRYGERILAEPEGRRWVILTTVPIAILLSGSLFLGAFLVRHRQKPPLFTSQATADLFPDSDWE